MKQFTLLAIAATLLTTAACGGGVDAVGPSSTPVIVGYSYTMSGNEARTVSGDASAASVFGDTTVTGVYLGIINRADGETLQFGFAGAHPAVGTYTVVPADTLTPHWVPKANEVVVNYLRGESTAGIYHIYIGQSGTVKVTESSATKIAASFSMSAKGGVGMSSAAAMTANKTVAITGAGAASR